MIKFAPKRRLCRVLLALCKDSFDNEQFNVWVQGDFMATPTGTVSVVDTTSGMTVASGALDATGNASLSWTSIAGTYNFVANYSGDGSFDPGQSAPLSYTVTAVLQTAIVTMSVNPASPQSAGTNVNFAVGVA